ncbi:MAG: hypothetical protein VX341_00660 [Bdellovibrionota bacterium]|nr:hypothetical protein [Bdellovibrionota bacterium]
MKIMVLFIILLTALVSCSKQAGTSEATFNLNFSAVSAEGTTMLWGENDLGGSFATVLHSSSADLELANARWNFFIINWNNSAGNLTGKVSCTSKRGVELTGEEIQVELILRNEGCMNYDFTPDSSAISLNDGSRRFPFLNIHSCQNLDNVRSDSSLCSTDQSNRGKAQSVRVGLLNFIEGDVGNIGTPAKRLVSDCLPIDPFSGTTFTNDVNIPFGYFGETPLKTGVVFFADGDCTPSEALGKKDDFLRGLHGPSGEFLTPNTKVFSNDQSLNLYFTHDESADANPVCARGFIPGKFSAGIGTLDRPYVICHPEEFNQIGDRTFLLSANYVLGQDIDFRLLIDDFYTDHLLCGKLDKKVNPVGGLFRSDCTEIIAPASFTGIFDGKNHSILYPFIEKKNLDHVGLFRKVGITGRVKNLNVVGPMIKGRSFVGAIVGENNGVIENITIRDGDIKSEGFASNSYVGGAIGTSSATSTVREVFIYKTQIHAKANNVGGVVGYSASSLENLGFNGIIIADNGNSNISNIGGIVGYSIQDINQTWSKGLIAGNILVTGGVVGKAVNFKTVSNSYSHMAIVTSNTVSTLKIGGIIGEGGLLNTYVNKSYFLGDMSYPCTTSCQTGSMGGLNVNAGAETLSHKSFGAGGIQANTTHGLSAFYNNSISSLGSEYIFETGNYPRLPSDNKSLCATDPIARDTISNQRDNHARGFGGDEAIICNPSQMLEIKNYPSLEYQLENPISLKDFSENSGPSGFAGDFYGENGYLHGLNISSIDDAGSYGLFGENTGNIYDLNIYASKLEDILTGGTNGVVASTNSGLIDKVSLEGVDFRIDQSSGLIVGDNAGRLSNVHIGRNSSIKGEYDNIGIVSGVNNDELFRVNIEGELSSVGSAVSFYGGVSGQNNGTIEEVRFSGTINLPHGTDVTYFGGITGKNYGDIKNIKIDKHAHIDIDDNGLTGMITSYNEVGSVIEDVIVEAMFKTYDSPNGADGSLIKENNGNLYRGFYKLVPGRRTGSAVSFTGLNQPDVSLKECQANFGGFRGRNINTIEDGNFYYPVISGGKDPGSVLVFDYSENPSFNCTGSRSFFVYENEDDAFDTAILVDSNLGERKTYEELRDFSTYCNTPIFDGNRQLVCDNDAAHFGIIYEDISRDIGTDIVLELFKGDLTGEELPEDFRFPWIYEATRGETPDLTFRR